ncbi:MAG: GNAT family N-acetyltransferase [Saprospiraceae bacterium]|nr:GNAT family N-acetyltransferase [Saprospiraceae bacterium]
MKFIAPSQTIPKGFTFRPGTNQDTENIISLVHNVLFEYGLIPEPNGVDLDLSNVEESYRDGYFGVIEDDEKIVATFGLFPLDNHTVEIRKMYAIPSVRGKGLGTWMVNHLIELAKNNGYKEIELETASSLIEAIQLYQKLGFQEKKFENKTPRCDKSFYLNI